MVLKLKVYKVSADLRFYSSVILNGTETGRYAIPKSSKFYSSVILNGTETPTELSVRS